MNGDCLPHSVSGQKFSTGDKMKRSITLDKIKIVTGSELAGNVCANVSTQICKMCNEDVVAFQEIWCKILILCVQSNIMSKTGTGVIQHPAVSECNTMSLMQIQNL